MTKIAIPYTPPDLGPNSDFQTKIFRKNREAVLSELRCLSGIPEIVSTLNQDTVYKIVCSPEGGKLYADTAGNLKGVFYKDGKIVQHAKLRAVGPSLVKCATAVGSQILLISIAMQLNRVEKEIHKIIEGLHDDRISEIYSGVSQYKHAMLVQDHERQSRLIENTTQTLTTGIEKTARSLKRQIAEIPEPSFWDYLPLVMEHRRVFGPPQDWVRRTKLIEESFQACIIGIQTLAECFATLNEPQVAAVTLKENISNLSRSVPQTFLDSEQLLHEKIERCGLLANNKFDCIEIEFKPVELLGRGTMNICPR